MRHASTSERSRADFVERGLKHFHATLRGREMRVSKARDAVVRCALSRAGSFCVEDLVHTLQAQGARDVHKGTVYRAMPLLVAAGIVRPQRGDRAYTQSYEVVFEQRTQPRLVCGQCGRTVEIEAQTLSALQRYLLRHVGFDLVLTACQLRGTCKACQRSLAARAR